MGESYPVGDWHDCTMWRPGGFIDSHTEGIQSNNCFHLHGSNAGQIPYNKGVTWPNLLVGAVATVLLAAGLIPPYFELWKRDGRVIGISEFHCKRGWAFSDLFQIGSSCRSIH